VRRNLRAVCSKFSPKRLETPAFCPDAVAVLLKVSSQFARKLQHFLENCGLRGEKSSLKREIPCSKALYTMLKALYIMLKALYIMLKSSTYRAQSSDFTAFSSHRGV
jgi:predicted transcriptional regulator